MPFPLVARSTLQAVEDALTDMRGINATLQARYDALLEKYHSLRVTGAVPVEPVRCPEPVEPSPIDEAITAKAGRNPALRRYLSQWAAGEKQKPGVTDESLADAILTWTDPDD